MEDLNLQIKIYTDQQSPRLDYVLDVVFKQHLGVEYVFSGDENEEGITINYSDKKLSGIQIISTGLVFQEGIEKQAIAIGEWEGMKTIFPSTGDIPFDLFSAVFYMLSRYEEYLDFTPDSHGRFPAAESIAFKNGFLSIPIVDNWIMKLGQMLKIEPKKNYFFLPTYDIDMAYSYKGKGFIKTYGGLLKNNFSKRLKVLLGKEKDPYDTYESMCLNGAKCFIHVGNNDKYDKSLPHNGSLMKNLISKLQDKCEIGIHPSYASNEKIEVLQKEIQCLKDVKVSRQHYLKMTFPATYQNLISVGIEEDYTMGFADAIGFRAGTSYPFYFYDLEKENVTPLKIIPFQVMDVTLKNYMKISPDQAFQEVVKLIDEVKKVSGTFSLLWHNESLSENKEWKGWKTVHDNIINYASES